MMNPLKLKVLEELLGHLSGSQGMDLKALLDEMKETPKEEAMESPLQQAKEESEGTEMHEPSGKPKGIAIEKVSLLSKPKSFDDKANEAMNEAVPEKKGNDEEMTDNELEELLKQYLK